MTTDIITALLEYVQQANLQDRLSLEGEISLKFLAQGEYNKNFLLSNGEKSYVLRVNYGSQINVPCQIEYEFQVLNMVYPSGVTPQPYLVDSSESYFPQGILVMQFLEGRPLDYKTDIEVAAKIFQKIHSVPISKNNPLIVETQIFTDRIKEANYLLADVWDSLDISREVKKILEQVLQYCHIHEHEQKEYLEHPLLCINNTEVNSRNFIINENKIENQTSYLVDWEKAVVSDPCQDLTHFLAPTTTLWKTDTLLSHEEQALFLKVYETPAMRANSFSIYDRVQQYNPYLYLRAISWCCFAKLQYLSPNSKLKNEETYRKIEQYLQSDFLDTLFKGIL